MFEGANTQSSVELAQEAGDVKMQQELLPELEDLKTRSEKYLVSLWLSGPVDENSAYVEVHAGSGGTEACDWAMMLSRMYARWANTQQYTGRYQHVLLQVPR